MSAKRIRDDTSDKKLKTLLIKNCMRQLSAGGNGNKGTDLQEANIEANINERIVRMHRTLKDSNLKVRAL